MKKMCLKLLMVFVFSLGLIFLNGSGISASDQKKVTPYGDYCSRMGHYGKHKSIIDLKQAEEALKHYYGEKRLDIDVVSREGRFIKVHVIDKHAVVDIIIFDRRTGRVRSVY
jgi:hypothetical protein